MSNYTKLFASITDSTIWKAPDATRLVWITLLAMADQNGIVEAAVPPLADRARVPLADCITALKFLSGPDPWSRTPDFEGRRIVAVDGGWFLINHAKYRAIRNADDRREQARVAMAKLREGRKLLADVSSVSHGEPPLAQAEEATDIDIEQDQKKGRQPPKAIAFPERPEFLSAESWQGYLAMRKQSKKFPTCYAAQLIIRKLGDLWRSGQNPNACLDQSTLSGWADVYPIKNGEGNGHQNSHGSSRSVVSRIEANIGKSRASRGE